MVVADLLNTAWRIQIEIDAVLPIAPADAARPLTADNS
jgi:hypothetical protein